MWGYDEKAASQEETSHKNPIMLVHWSWLPASRTRRKFLLFKPLSLRYSVMAVPTWLIHPVRWQLPLPGPSSKGMVHHSWLQKVWRVRDSWNCGKGSRFRGLGGWRAQLIKLGQMEKFSFCQTAALVSFDYGTRDVGYTWKPMTVAKNAELQNGAGMRWDFSMWNWYMGLFRALYI